jgi:hypothetical protein
MTKIKKKTDFPLFKSNKIFLINYIMKNLYFVLVLLLTTNIAHSLETRSKNQEQLCYEDVYGDRVVYGDGSQALDEECVDEGYDIQYTDEVNPECEETIFVPIIVHKECPGPGPTPGPHPSPKPVHDEIIVHAKEEQEIRKEIQEHTLKEEEKHHEKLEDIQKNKLMSEESKKQELSAELERHEEAVEEIKEEVSEQIKEERKEERKEAQHLSDLMKSMKKGKKDKKAKQQSKKEKLDELLEEEMYENHEVEEWEDEVREVTEEQRVHEVAAEAEAKLDSHIKEQASIDELELSSLSKEELLQQAKEEEREEERLHEEKLQMSRTESYKRDDYHQQIRKVEVGQQQQLVQDRKDEVDRETQFLTKVSQAHCQDVHQITALRTALKEFNDLEEHLIESERKEEHNIEKHSEEFEEEKAFEESRKEEMKDEKHLIEEHKEEIAEEREIEHHLLEESHTVEDEIEQLSEQLQHEERIQEARRDEQQEEEHLMEQRRDERVEEEHEETVEKQRFEEAYGLAEAEEEALDEELKEEKHDQIDLQRSEGEIRHQIEEEVLETDTPLPLIQADETIESGYATHTVEHKEQPIFINAPTPQKTCKHKGPIVIPRQTTSRVIKVVKGPITPGCEVPEEVLKAQIASEQQQIEDEITINEEFY